jgi:hypothetical protein
MRALTAQDDARRLVEEAEREIAAIKRALQRTQSDTPPASDRARSAVRGAVLRATMP